MACMYLTDTKQWTFQTVPIQPRALHNLIVMESPDRVVIEMGNQTVG